MRSLTPLATKSNKLSYHINSSLPVNINPNGIEKNTSEIKKRKFFNKNTPRLIKDVICDFQANKKYFYK